MATNSFNATSGNAGSLILGGYVNCNELVQCKITYNTAETNGLYAVTGVDFWFANTQGDLSTVGTTTEGGTTAVTNYFLMYLGDTETGLVGQVNGQNVYVIQMPACEWGTSSVTSLVCEGRGTDDVRTYKWSYIGRGGASCGCSGNWGAGFATRNLGCVFNGNMPTTTATSVVTAGSFDFYGNLYYPPGLYVSFSRQDNLYTYGYGKGYDAGFDEGYEDGYTAGYADGQNDAKIVNIQRYGGDAGILKAQLQADEVICYRNSKGLWLPRGQ